MSAPMRPSSTPGRAAIEAASGADTGILRIEVAGTHDLDLDRFVMDRGSSDEPPADAVSTAREQCEADPAGVLDRGCRGGDIAEGRRRRGRRDELRAVSQTLRGYSRSHADQL